MAKVQTKIMPFLWYAREAEEAARFYVSLFPDSRIDRISTMPAESPSGPAGSVVLVDFTLAGQQFMAMTAGPLDPFNHAISLYVSCEDQAEVDRLWEAFSKEGTIEECGWVRDKFGVAWQIVPAKLAEMMAAPDRARGKRVAEAMLTMKKLDIATLEKAFEGK